MPQTLMFKRQCLPVIQSFTQTAPFSDVEFVLGLALNFKAVILYESLLYRRLHETGYSSINWENGYYEWLKIIDEYTNRKLLPVKAAKDSLFRLYIEFGENCLVHRQQKKAIGNFLKAWSNNPFSIIPVKKTGKAIVHYFKSKQPG